MTRFIPIRPGSRCACLGAAREYNALGVAPNDGQAGAEGTKDQEPRQADISLAAPIMLGATMLLAHGLPVWPRLAAQLGGDGANQRPESKKTVGSYLRMPGVVSINPTLEGAVLIIPEDCIKSRSGRHAP